MAADEDMTAQAATETVFAAYKMKKEKKLGVWTVKKI